VMFDYAARFERAVPYAEFLDRYAGPAERARWDAQLARTALTPEQAARLAGWTRRMKVLVMAGAWCGDCIENCPSFVRFREAAPVIDLRFIDRDADDDLKAQLALCGAPRVPQVVFLSEDDHYCGQAGDKPLVKYRYLAEKKLGNKVKDVSAEKCGWDVTSVTPRGVTRHIEVKGRYADADTVVVTANEVLEALNQGEKFILAIVRVDGGRVDGPHYVRAPFTKELEGSVVSVNYSIRDLLKRAMPPHTT